MNYFDIFDEINIIDPISLLPVSISDLCAKTVISN